jgi:RNA polymerase sigma factor (sigma-70 family)
MHEGRADAAVLDFPQDNDLQGSDVAVRNLEEARDRDLMARVAAGDEEAFRTLYRRYAAPAYGLALRVVKQVFLAEEIVQETFLSLWRGAAAYDEARGTPRTWLLSSVHHRAVDGVRREQAHQRRAERSIGKLDLPPDMADAVVEALDLRGERIRVREALADLSAEQREVVTLMYYDGLTQTQVSERLSLPLGTVKSRCLLAMRRLRAALSPRGAP